MENSTLQVGKIYKTKARSNERLKYIGFNKVTGGHVFKPLKKTSFLKYDNGKYRGKVGFSDIVGLGFFIEVND